MLKTIFRKKPNSTKLGIAIICLISIQTTYPAFQASMRAGCRRLAPTLRRQFSTQNLPATISAHAQSGQEQWLRHALFTAGIASFLMMKSKKTAHCDYTPLGPPTTNGWAGSSKKNHHRHEAIKRRDFEGVKKMLAIRHELNLDEALDVAKAEGCQEIIELLEAV